jgi:toxin ParE1/3/4
MLVVDWKDEALDDLALIYFYISQRNPIAAVSLRQTIIDAAEKLPLFPYLYRSGRMSGTRECVVHPNYILVYRVAARSIEIIGVLHAKQEYPKI